MFSQEFLNHGCDLIALQELLAENNSDLIRGLSVLAMPLGFKGVAGYVEGGNMHLGVLYSEKKLEFVEARLNYAKPLALCSEKVVSKLRPALEVGFRVDGRHVLVSAIHLKSRANSGGDIFKVKSEGSRMCQAMAIRASFNTRATPFVVVGDRNGGIESASSAILSGRRKFTDFLNGNCIVTPEGRDLCKLKSKTTQLKPLYSSFPSYPLDHLGSFNFKGKWQQLDDVLYSSDFRQVGGFVSEINPELSDHSLIYADLQLVDP